MLAQKKRLVPEWDLAIVGAGPCGVAALCEAHGLALRAVALERGRICDSVKQYPPETVFHTTAPFLEVDGRLPETLDGEHVAPAQVAEHFTKLALLCPLPVVEKAKVERLERVGPGFELEAPGLKLRARSVLLATGHYDAPRRLGVPGERGAHVSRKLDSGRDYAGKAVLVVGGSASALEAAERLLGAGAQVTMVHRGGELGYGLQEQRKAGVLDAVRRGGIRLELDTVVERFEGKRCRLRRGDAVFHIPFDEALVFTGMSASTALARQAGVTYSPGGIAAVNAQEGRTGVPGLYLVGAAYNGDRRIGRIGMKSGIPQARRAVREIAERLGSGQT